jgi:protein CrcB
MGYLIVFLGGGIGAALRHGFNIAFARLLGTAFPYATLFENVSGSIVMGMLVATFAFRSGIPHHWQLFLTTGILGGYTTSRRFRSTSRCYMSVAKSVWRRSTSCYRSRCRSAGCLQGSCWSATSLERPLVHSSQAELFE